AHILIGFGQSVQNRRDRDAARALADSLKQVLQAAPDRLAELAAAFSDDRSAAQNGGDLGWQKDGTFVKPFNQALIDGRVGDITVVETAFGFHVLRIIDKTAPVKKVLACVISMPVEPSIETAKDVYAQASRFLSQCKNGADFDSVARQNGMRVRTATRVDELADQMPGLTNAREIVRWAYNKDNKAGDVAQEVFEMENRYVVATLKKRHKEGYMPLSELKEMPQLEYRIKRDVKADRLMEKAKTAEGKTSVAQVAEAWGVTADQAENVTFNGYAFGARGYEPALIGTLFGLKEGQLSKPVKGNSGVYVLASEGLTVGEGNPDMIRFQMMQSFQQRTFNLVRAALGEDYGIKDNRAMYF
ncbi:MAG: peptidylprolyl isomerase, partial [Bacteroidales bacterium]|nr:peptidylprolyl isomerase [Bacteroidales bacterium]